MATVVRSVARRSTRRPILTVALVAGVGALVSAVWIWRTRQLGAFDPDEAGYLATALRLQRSIGWNPDVLRELASTEQGPLVPLLSVPLLVLGPRDPRTAMLIQPMFVVLSAVAVTGVTRRLAGPGAAVLAGCVTASLPMVVLASEAYWFGLAAGAFTATALWALLASDRFDSRWRFAFGAALGAMLLSRTMALGLVPAMVVAAAIQTGGDRRRLWRLLQALAVTAAVAAPWYFVQRDAVFSYLFDYGYGDRAGLWGSGGPLARLWFRIDRLSTGSGLPGPAIAAFIVVVAVAVALSARSLSLSRPWGTSTRDWVSCVCVVILGLAALVTTTNQGVWFELPVLLVLVAVVAAGLDRVGGSSRAVIAGVTVLVIVGIPIAMRLQGTTQARPALVEHDQRFDDATTADDAATDWRRLTEEVLRAVPDAGSDRAVSLSGNTFLFNSNTLELAAELAGRDIEIRVPDTLADSDSRAAELTPSVGGVPRDLLVALHDRALFTPDLDVQSFYDQALATGWRPVERWPMPGGGDVVLLRHGPGSP